MFSVQSQAAQDSSDLAREVFRQEIKSQSTGAPAVSVGESGRTTGTPATTNTNNSGVPSMGGSSINPSALAGQQSQSSGAGINAAAGAALIAAGLAPKPPNMALVAMGIMALMQAGHDAGAAGQSANTFDISKYDTGLGTNGGGTGSKDPTKGSGGYTSASIEQGKAALQEAGYVVSEKGVTSPDGTFTPAASFGSPSSLAAAGFDPNAIREAGNVTAALNDEVSKLNAGRVSGVAVNGGGGAGGGDGGAGDGGGSSEYSSEYGNGAGGPGGAGAFDRRKMMAGKTVNFDGEPIGVRGQNIFDMVHECYQKKRAGKHFIETESGGGGPVRLPASLPGKRK